MTVLKYWDQTSGTYKTLTGPPGPAGPGVPAGGAAGTVLGKNSATDFDTIWSGPMLPLTGGTLSGPLSVTLGSGSTPLTVKAAAGVGTYLAIDKAAGFDSNLIGSVAGKNRWQVTLGNSATETGSNVGSDFAIWRCTDAGGYIDAPLTITRSTGTVAINTTGSTTALTVKGSGATSLTIDKAANSVGQIVHTNAGSLRWVVVLSNAAAESGSNAGSDFQINNYSDAGVNIGTPLIITRSNGNAAFGSSVTVNGSALAMNNSGGVTLQLISPNATVHQIASYTGASAVAGTTRWVFQMGDGTSETGSNAGCNAMFYAYGDSGAGLGPAWSAVRSTQVVTFAKAIVNGSSDRTLKENIAPLEDSLAKVMQLQGVSFNMIGDEDRRRQIGLIAQDVAPIVPEIIQEYRSGEDEPKLALDYPKLVALLIEAIKEQQARIEALEAR